MHVSKVELIEKENLITQNNKVPCTFFSLDASEMLDFNNFRRHHDELSGIVREMSGEERQKEEGKAESEFLGLVTPFLEQCGIKPVNSHLFYGDYLAFVETPAYILFENNTPFDVTLKADYIFSMREGTLSCTSKLDYHGRGSVAESPSRHMVYDLIKKVLEGKKQKQDGIDFPAITFRGDFIQFGSVEYTKPLMGVVHTIINSIGPEAMKELSILHEGYTRHVNFGDISDTTVQQRVFREAYERKADAELVRANFIKPQLRRVKW